MPKTTIKKTTIVVLRLNEAEAEWLKGIMQNAINTSYEKEEEKDRKMRFSFWKALGGQV